MLNAKRPWPVAARHTVGQMLPDVVFGCLHPAIGGGVPAEGASALWNPQIFGGGSLVDEIEDGTDANDAAGILHGDFPLRRLRRAAAQGRLERERVSFRRAHHPDGSDRKRRAGDLLSPRIPRRLRRRRQMARRSRPGDRARRRRRDADRAAVQFRAGAKSGARPRRRRRRSRRSGLAAVRQTDPSQGPPNRSAARRHSIACPGRRRLRRSAHTGAGAGA